METPTHEHIDCHEATRTPYKRWCNECNQGLAVRDQHSKKKKTKAGTRGNAHVPDTEEPKDGQTKYSMDHMTMDSFDAEKAPSS